MKRAPGKSAHSCVAGVYGALRMMRVSDSDDATGDVIRYTNRHSLVARSASPNSQPRSSQAHRMFEARVAATRRSQKVGVLPHWRVALRLACHRVP